MKNYYQRNKDKLIQYGKNYNKINKYRKREYYKQYYQIHKKKILERMKQNKLNKPKKRTIKIEDINMIIEI